MKAGNKSARVTQRDEGHEEGERGRSVALGVPSDF